MGGHWLDTRRGNRCRIDEALRGLREEYDREVERLKAEDPDWVKELLARLS